MLPCLITNSDLKSPLLNYECKTTAVVVVIVHNTHSYLVLNQSSQGWEEWEEVDCVCTHMCTTIDASKSSDGTFHQDDPTEQYGGLV